MKKEANYIELGSFLFLVGVALAILLPGYQNVAHMKATAQNLNVCRQNLTIISQAVDTYAKQNKGRLPERLDALTYGKKPILVVFPLCPAAEKASYQAPSGYVCKQGSVPRYTVKCFGNNHNELGMKKDEPYYDSLYGIQPSSTTPPKAP